MLGTFLQANGIKQVELVEGMDADKGQVSRWANDPEANITRENIDAILTWLAVRLGRPVTYEETFGHPVVLPAAANE